MLPPSSTNLKDLSWLQAYEIFHRLCISPDYLDCARFRLKGCCTIDELKLEKSVSDGLVSLLPIQPFLGLELYILGSLSCAAMYSNDAEFNGWDEKPKKQGVIKNNCYLTY